MDFLHLDSSGIQPKYKEQILILLYYFILFIMAYG